MSKNGWIQYSERSHGVGRSGHENLIIHVICEAHGSVDHECSTSIFHSSAHLPKFFINLILHIHFIQVLPVSITLPFCFFSTTWMLKTAFILHLQLLSHSSTRNQHGPEAVLYLMLMVNYRKHEMTNPYTVNLSLLDDELILNGYGQVRSW